MRVAEIITLFPGARDIMAEWGLHCSSCSLGGMETLAEGCRMHGYDDDDLTALLADLNEGFAAIPERPATLELTAAAAQGIRDIAAAEGREGEGLAVIVDEAGGFCMEFRKDPEEGDMVFTRADEPEIRLFASPATLRRIGGATIDLRDGRFKLDLPEDACGCHGNTCACAQPHPLQHDR